MNLSSLKLKFKMPKNLTAKKTTKKKSKAKKSVSSKVSDTLRALASSMPWNAKKVSTTTARAAKKKSSPRKSI